MLLAERAEVGRVQVLGSREEGRNWLAAVAVLAAGQQEQACTEQCVHARTHCCAVHTAVSPQQDCARINKSVQDPPSPFVPLWSDLDGC